MNKGDTANRKTFFVICVVEDGQTVNKITVPANAIVPLGPKSPMSVLKKHIVAVDDEVWQIISTKL